MSERLDANNVTTPDWLTPQLLAGMQRGIEREALRVTSDSQLSKEPHPKNLGSALTHPHITTDYSEALIELITPPRPNIPEALAFLEALHLEVKKQLPENEHLWPLSMPAQLPKDEADIPLANYGSSGLGQFKTLYRKGLGLRYGRRMQTIAGLHYNLSFPDVLFNAWFQQENGATADAEQLRLFKDAKYLGLIRNFLRLTPLIIYLYGASPALDQSFIANRNHHLNVFSDDTLYRPFATALRMGRLGYQNSAQRHLGIHYNSLPSYLEGLVRAVKTPYSEFTRIGINDSNLNPQQINDHILQIENEYYSLVRPKQVAKVDETPAEALKNSGIAYVELRAIDIDPFSPIGITESGAAFLEVVALASMMLPSPALYFGEEERLSHNQAQTIDNGLQPRFEIEMTNGPANFRDWAKIQMENLYPFALLLDDAYQTSLYSDAWTIMHTRLTSPSQTNAAQIMQEVSKTGSHIEYGQLLAHQQAHQRLYNQHPDINFKSLADASLLKQHQLENNGLSLQAYLQQYQDRIHQL